MARAFQLSPPRVMCFIFIVWRHQLADIAARAILPVGAGFALITLVTGSLWGKPIWGTYWVWDARLTSMLVLFMFFIGYGALRYSFENVEKGARMASILAFIGCIRYRGFQDSWNNAPACIDPVFRRHGYWQRHAWLLVMFYAFQLFYLDSTSPDAMDGSTPAAQTDGCLSPAYHSDPVRCRENFNHTHRDTG